jgi:hypothetical protein
MNQNSIVFVTSIFEPNPFIQRAVRMLAYRTCAALAPHDMLTRSSHPCHFLVFPRDHEQRGIAVVTCFTPNLHIGIAALAGPHARKKNRKIVEL